MFSEDIQSIKYTPTMQISTQKYTMSLPLTQSNKPLLKQPEYEEVLKQHNHQSEKDINDQMIDDI